MKFFRDYMYNLMLLIFVLFFSMMPSETIAWMKKHIVTEEPEEQQLPIAVYEEMLVEYTHC